jgi:hypothetical protein
MVVWGRSTAQVEASLDAMGGAVASLGTSPSLEPLERIADEKHLLVGTVVGSGTTYAAEVPAGHNQPTVAQPLAAIVGTALAPSASEYVAALLYGSDSEAAANAAPLQAAVAGGDQQWATVYGVDTDGAALVETRLELADLPASTPPVAFPPPLQ